MRNTLGGSLAFPIDIAGAVALDADESASLVTLATRVERAFERQHVKHITRQGAVVSVRLGAFENRGSGLEDRLGFFDSGVVEVRGGSPVSIEYRFSCRRTLVTYVGGLLAVGVFLAFQFRSLDGPWALAFAALAVLATLQFAFGYAVAASRIPEFFEGVQT